MSHLPLASIFHGDTAYLNQEVTIPAQIAGEALYRNPILEDNPELEKEIQGMLRVIVHPNSATVQTGSRREIEKILESPYECGRVLESPNKILVNDIAYTISVKGVGATQFYRETQAIHPWQSTSPDPEITTALSTRTFHGARGVFDREDAIMSVKWFELLKTFGVETETPLAIYRIESLPDEDGIMQSIKILKKKWYLHKDIDPVLYVRMSRTNFRLMDPIRMNETEHFQPLMKPLFDHILTEYRKISENNQATLQEYLEWLMQKITSQEILLMRHNISHGWERWPDFWRNLSLLGEIIDLDDVEKYLRTQTRSLRDIEDFLGRRMDLVIGNIRQVINALIGAGEEIDTISVARIFIDTIQQSCMNESGKMEIITQDLGDEKISANLLGIYVRILARKVHHYTWWDHEDNTLQESIKNRLLEKYNVWKNNV